MTRLTIYLAIITTSFSCSVKDNSKNATVDKPTETTSTSGYEFDGNYLPTKEFKINDHLLNSIEIGTDDSLGGNQIELIYIRFTNLTTDNYYVITNTKFEGTKDNFSISAADPVLGKIQISGSFLGQRGPANDNIKDPSTIVFKGHISADGIKNEKIECRYFEGD